MTDRVVAVFHTECCSSSATAALGAGKAPFITGVDAPRMQRQQLLCKKNVLVQSADNMLHLQQQQSMIGVHGSSASSPSTKVLFQLNVRNSESKSKHQRSSSSSASASASHTRFNSTTSVLVADPAAAAVKKKGPENPPTSVNHHLASPATTTKDRRGGSSGKMKKKDQQQQQQKQQQQQQFHGAALLSNSPDEYERMLMNLIDQLHGIHLHALALEQWHAPELKNVHR